MRELACASITGLPGFIFSQETYELENLRRFCKNETASRANATLRVGDRRIADLNLCVFFPGAKVTVDERITLFKGAGKSVRKTLLNLGCCLFG